MSAALDPRLAATLAAAAEPANVPAARREVLDRLAAWIADRRRAGAPARLLFVCTHNSRRSHLAALWAWAAAAHLGLDGVETFSAGTEATALHPNAAAALARAGFTVRRTGEGANPTWAVALAPGGAEREVLSRDLAHPSLPRDGFAAVMTCAEADAGCPLVPGAAARFPLPYDDPKAADGTPAAAATYDERSRQIARELLDVLTRAADAAAKERPDER